MATFTSLDSVLIRFGIDYDISPTFYKNITCNMIDFTCSNKNYWFLINSLPIGNGIVVQ